MAERPTWSPEETWAALDAARVRYEAERRAAFAQFGIESDCLWPCSRLFHEHSALGPAWRPALTVGEVESLTRDGNYRRYPGAPRTALPPGAALTARLDETIRSRRSRSTFSDRAIGMEPLATLLQLSAGVTAVDEIPRRAAPSGGALFPVETYVLGLRVEGLAPGTYHYLPLEHALEHLGGIATPDVTASFLPPGLFAARPPVVVAFTVVFDRTQRKYLERGYRFALLEAGHIAQNLVLTACALHLHAIPVGGFWDEPFNQVLGVNPPDEAAVYAVLIGHPPADGGAGSGEQ